MAAATELVKPATTASFLPEHSRTTSTGCPDRSSRAPTGGNLKLGRMQDLGRSQTSGQLLSALARFDHHSRAMPIALRTATVRAPMGPAPEDHHLVIGRDISPGDPVQGHGQRLGQGGRRLREVLGKGQQGRGSVDDVAGKGPVATTGDRGLAVLALGGLSFQAALTVTASWGRSTDDAVAGRPLRDLRADGHHGAAELVPEDRARTPPSLEHEVDVGAANTAMVHLHQDFAVSGLGGRTILHLDLAGSPVHGHRHHIGYISYIAHGHIPLSTSPRTRPSSALPWVGRQKGALNLTPVSTLSTGGRVDPTAHEVRADGAEARAAWIASRRWRAEDALSSIATLAEGPRARITRSMFTVWSAMAWTG